jgi:hypothetical protein
MHLPPVLLGPDLGKCLIITGDIFLLSVHPDVVPSSLMSLELQCALAGSVT